MFNQFYKNTSGNVALLVGVLAVPLLTAVGAAVDYTLHSRASSALQNAADSAALASARELGLTSISDEDVKSIANTYIFDNLRHNLKVKQESANLKVETDISASRKDVTVKLAYTWAPLILHYVNSTVLPITVSAKASLVGSESICVVALDGAASSSLAMTGASSLQANDCAIYSNSSSANGIEIVAGAAMSSSSTYSGGGYNGPLDGYKPRPVTDSPGIDDPLLDRPAPPVNKSCAGDNEGLELNIDSEPLEPGVYCGGIRTVGNVHVTLEPGVYIIKDGPLNISGNSTLTGEGVGFYFTGEGATFDFGVTTQISLSAPKTGPLSGILFFEDRNSPSYRNFVIRSKDAEKLEGTVYLPQGRLIVDQESRVGQLSDWTAIIARQIEIKIGPQLSINADYGASDIPVPDGIAPTTTPHLTR